jgi:hypothetical protein
VIADGILEFAETSRGGYGMRILMELKVIISQTSSSVSHILFW